MKTPSRRAAAQSRTEEMPSASAEPPGAVGAGDVSEAGGIAVPDSGDDELSVTGAGDEGEPAPVPLPLLEGVVEVGGVVDGGGGLVVHAMGGAVDEPGGSVVVVGGGGVVLAVPPSILQDLRNRDCTIRFLRLDAEDMLRAWVEPAPRRELDALVRACIPRRDVLRAIQCEERDSAAALDCYARSLRTMRQRPGQSKINQKGRRTLECELCKVGLHEEQALAVRNRYTVVDRVQLA
ncbi:hypothetical protein EXIGLDRAFT_96935 [Exidia glandulosa HHB12029]|uniref:Uncharacterized protein n=1 Tax=Exidia glandulosa HHB12029 TaxID=1314781 RepID=A0A165H3K2_EXIGL|nr:hypothetical protein EXIGLDRAFT_96935 [Exidia glandulosa HHB12029]